LNLGRDNGVSRGSSQLFQENAETVPQLTNDIPFLFITEPG
jgi:hypothetical protein